MTKKIFNVEGMTCTKCELNIEMALSKIDGIKDVKGRYSESLVEVAYDSKAVQEESIINAIEKLGYQIKLAPNVLETTKTEFYQIKKENVHMIGIMILLIALYLIIQKTIGFNSIPDVSSKMSYGLLFLVGLLTSIHCIAMCGGINLSQCVAYRSNERIGSVTSTIKPSILYNSGRVLSYTIIGGVVGSLGSVLSLSTNIKGTITIAAGLFMMIMAINMLNLFPVLKKINPRMPKIFGKTIQKNSKNHGPFYIGLLNGFMPCGPLQAMQLYALGTGSFIGGALSMFAFSIGTVPLMFGLGAVSTYMGQRTTKNLLKLSAFLVVILGMAMISRGMNLTGAVIPLQSSSLLSSLKDDITSDTKIKSPTNQVNQSDIIEGIQYVTTTLAGGRYTPFTVTDGIPVKWTILVEEEDLNGCNNPVTIPKYGIQQLLVVGENVIEFTPVGVGNITYTCWMGMISSQITVTDTQGNFPDEIIGPYDTDGLMPSNDSEDSCCVQ
jgi:sulfite exporter TauE/SafE/copper chaperone CopZ